MLVHYLILRSRTLCTDWLPEVHLARVLRGVSPSCGLVLIDVSRWQVSILIEAGLAAASYRRARAILLVVLLGTQSVRIIHLIVVVVCRRH